MGTLWFWIVAVMLTAYVVLDGFDLGVGSVFHYVARTEEERQHALRAIGPVWDGNEVWLLAAGGTLFFAFPLLQFFARYLLWSGACECYPRRSDRARQLLLSVALD